MITDDQWQSRLELSCVPWVHIRWRSSLQTLPIIRCCCQAHGNAPARLSQADQLSKERSFGLFVFIPRSIHKFLKKQPLPCTQQIPHLRTWENRLLQEGENYFQHGGFPVELEKAVWPYRLTLRECQHLLPQRAPPQCASLSFVAGGPSPVLPPPKMWASNCIMQVFPNPVQGLLIGSAPAHGDQPPHHFSSQGSPKDPAY